MLVVRGRNHKSRAAGPRRRPPLQTSLELPTRMDWGRSYQLLPRQAAGTCLAFVAWRGRSAGAPGSTDTFGCRSQTDATCAASTAVPRSRRLAASAAAARWVGSTGAEHGGSRREREMRRSRDKETNRERYNEREKGRESGLDQNGRCLHLSLNRPGIHFPVQ